MLSNIYVVVGNARTFTKCIDSLYDNVIAKLFHDSKKEINTHILFYLKLTDAGEKKQFGFNFTYKDVSEEEINEKLDKLEKNNITIHKHIINTNEISDKELFAQVKDRSKYIFFLSSNDKLIRCMHFLYNIEQCGKLIENIEHAGGFKFDYYIFVRPDLYFLSPQSSFNLCDMNTTVSANLYDEIKNSGKIILCNEKKDLFAIIPNQYFNKFFKDLMNEIRTNTTKHYIDCENIYLKVLEPFDVKFICKYYIKRD